jgi:diguanylate cyclase (GGDEF)-like protein/PAS domain S-box-containing protein
MLIQFNAYLIPYIIGILITLVLAIIILRSKSGKNYRLTSLLLISCTVWMLGCALEILNTTIVGKIIFGRIQYFGISTVPLLFFLLTMEYAGFTRMLKKERIIALSIIPAASLVLFLTNNIHSLMWKNEIVHSSGLLKVLSINDYGTAFWVWTSFSYILFFISTIFLFFIFASRYRFFRYQAITLISALIIAWTINILYVFNLIPLIKFDLTPIAVSFSCLVLVFGFTYLKIGEIVPINYESIIGSIKDGVIVLDKEGRINFLNKQAQDLFSTGRNFIGKSIDNVWHDYSINFPDAELEVEKDVMINTHQEDRYFNISVSLLKISKMEIGGRLIVIKDITERKKSEEKIKYISFHDNLTDLYNRAYFDEELKRLDRERQLPLSIIIGDVNGLKLINDGFGHKKGDLLLRKCAKVLVKSCRSEDIICRWGGDEFAIFLPKTQEEKAKEIVERIRVGCIDLENKKLPLSISLGVATKTEQLQNLQKVIKSAEDRMYRRKLVERKSISSSILSAFSRALFEKGLETEKHAYRVSALSRRIGKAINLSEDKLNDLSLLSLLHDIGKVAIAENILMKKGELTKEETRMVRRHTIIGYNIAKSTIQLAHIADSLLYHHEWWNGNGYPHKLKGDSIPINSRITAVVDAYDVMTNGCPYKKAISKKKSIETIKGLSGIQFDPGLVEIFIEILGGLGEDYLEEIEKYEVFQLVKEENRIII